MAIAPAFWFPGSRLRIPERVQTVQGLVLARGLAEVGKPYSGPMVNQPDSFRFGNPGWDCSSFVATMYHLATDGRVVLTPFTDAIGSTTRPLEPSKAVPGDIVLWRYRSTAQPNTRWPHTGLVWSQDLAQVLDARYPFGVGIHPTLDAPAQYRRAFGVDQLNDEGSGGGAVEYLLEPLVLAAALGANHENVKRAWPLIEQALARRGILDRSTAIAAAATVFVEVGASFESIEEYADGWAYDPSRNPSLAAQLGNTRVGDGPRYKGRGLLQLTGRGNYREYGREIGVDLEAQPERALELAISAEVLALYWLRRGIDDLDDAGDWVGVRRAVNGGTNGLQTFLAAVRKLEALA